MLVFDASGIADSTQLHDLWAFLHPTIRRVRRSGRVLVLGTPPDDCKNARQATAQQALEGFVRSVAKEVRRGSTAQLIYVGRKAEDQIESTLRFYLSPKSAYVSGQVVRIGASALSADGIDWERPLAGKYALVTGASRGIGRAISQVLARDGAHVIGLDVPALERELEETIGGLGGSTLMLDITDDDAPARLATYLLENHGGVDVVVHNAGVTRDKTLGRMSDEQWDKVIAINLTAQERINEELLGREVFHENGRIVSVSSMSGIAGNAGQTNYAASKAGVIGMVARDGARGRQEAVDDQRGGSRLHRDPDDRCHADRHARGGPADEQPRAGWPARRRGGGHRLVREPGIGRRQRDRGARMRAEPGGRLMATRELDGAPSMLPLFARAGAAMIPGASHLPFVGGGGRDVPDTALRLTDVAIDGDRLTAYDRVCAFDLRDTVPPTYPAHPGLPAPALADDRPELSVPGHRPGAHRTTGSPSTARSARRRSSRSTCGRRRSRTTRAASSSRCAPRSAWVRSSCGRRSRRT